MIDKIIVTVTIKASITKVWDFYTNPAHIIKWNFADPSWHCPRASNIMEVGGIYNARMEAKDGSFGFDFEAVYTEINIGEHFTYKFGDRFATVSFQNMADETVLVVTFDPETTHPIEMQKNGWQAILNNFKNYTENETS